MGQRSRAPEDRGQQRRRPGGGTNPACAALGLRPDLRPPRGGQWEGGPRATEEPRYPALLAPGSRANGW